MKLWVLAFPHRNGKCQELVKLLKRRLDNYGLNIRYIIKIIRAKAKVLYQLLQSNLNYLDSSGPR